LGAAERDLFTRWASIQAGKPRAIHRGRVATRRCREILVMVAAGAGDELADRLRRDVRRVTRALGAVRELDVAIEELAKVGGRLRVSETDRLAIQAQLERRRARRLRTMREKLNKVDRDRLRARTRELAEHMQRSETSEVAWRRLLGARIVRRANEAAAALAECGTLYAPDRLHAVRVAVKKLRYALEIARTAGQPDLAAPLSRLRRAQQDFGHLHDVQVLQAEVRDLATRLGRGRRSGAADTVVEDLEPYCREIHAKQVTRFPALDEVMMSARQVGRANAVRSGRLRMAKAVVRPYRVPARAHKR
jgi:CHAD domain-containing protein